MSHKCFISFKTEDLSYKEEIQSTLNIDMIDKSLNVPIESDDEDYIMRRIREDYISDSTVTIHLIGDPSVPGTTSTNSTGIAERGLQGLISGKPVPCTLSTKSTTTSL